MPLTDNHHIFFRFSELGDPLRAHAFLDKALNMKADDTKVFMDHIR